MSETKTNNSKREWEKMKKGEREGEGMVGEKEQRGKDVEYIIDSESAVYFGSLSPVYS